MAFMIGTIVVQNIMCLLISSKALQIHKKVNQQLKSKGRNILWPDYELYDILEVNNRNISTFLSSANNTTCIKNVSSQKIIEQIIDKVNNGGIIFTHLTIQTIDELQNTKNNCQGWIVYLTSRKIAIDSIMSSYCNKSQEYSLKMSLLSLKSPFYPHYIELTSEKNSIIITPAHFRQVGSMEYEMNTTSKQTLNSIILYGAKYKPNYGHQKYLRKMYRQKENLDGMEVVGSIKFRSYTSFLERQMVDDHQQEKVARKSIKFDIMNDPCFKSNPFQIKKEKQNKRQKSNNLKFQLKRQAPLELSQKHISMNQKTHKDKLSEPFVDFCKVQIKTNPQRYQQKQKPLSSEDQQIEQWFYNFKCIRKRSQGQEGQEQSQHLQKMAISMDKTIDYFQDHTQLSLQQLGKNTFEKIIILGLFYFSTDMSVVSDLLSILLKTSQLSNLIELYQYVRPGKLRYCSWFSPSYKSYFQNKHFETHKTYFKKIQQKSLKLKSSQYLQDQQDKYQGSCQFINPFKSQDYQVEIQLSESVNLIEDNIIVLPSFEIYDMLVRPFLILNDKSVFLFLQRQNQEVGLFKKENQICSYFDVKVSLTTDAKNEVFIKELAWNVTSGINIFGTYVMDSISRKKINLLLEIKPLVLLQSSLRYIGSRFDYFCRCQGWNEKQFCLNQSLRSSNNLSKKFSSLLLQKEQVLLSKECMVHPCCSKCDFIKESISVFAIQPQNFIDLISQRAIPCPSQFNLLLVVVKYVLVNNLPSELQLLLLSLLRYQYISLRLLTSLLKEQSITVESKKIIRECIINPKIKVFEKSDQIRMPLPREKQLIWNYREPDFFESYLNLRNNQ